MKRNLAALLFGVILLLAGFCYVGSIFFDYNFTIFFDGWWTLFIIVPGFVSLLANGPRAFNIAAILVGVVLLLTRLDVIPSRYFGEVWVGTIALYFGIYLIVRYFRGPRQYVNPPPSGATYNINVNAPDGSSTSYTENGGNTTFTQTNADGSSTNYNQGGTGSTGSRGGYNSDVNDFPNYTAILSGVNSRCISTNFKGARISAVLGGAEVDLRGVTITQDIVVYATAVLGGVDILAPMNVRISVKNTDILGGTECTAYSQPADAQVPLVTFVTTAVLGGVEIK